MNSYLVLPDVFKVLLHFIPVDQFPPDRSVDAEALQGVVLRGRDEVFFSEHLQEHRVIGF